ncbi:hypothetical protein DL95DRAFT_53349 [Leptodontidium sp. 2 PMI_412]|nr:hypothetical protein DL95DRAFT_53349 [Leptodontidium sp. 2 PMI_412]
MQQNYPNLIERKSPNHREENVILNPRDNHDIIQVPLPSSPKPSQLPHVKTCDRPGKTSVYSLSALLSLQDPLRKLYKVLRCANKKRYAFPRAFGSTHVYFLPISTFLKPHFSSQEFQRQRLARDLHFTRGWRYRCVLYSSMRYQAFEWC